MFGLGLSDVKEPRGNPCQGTLDISLHPFPHSAVCFLDSELSLCTLWLHLTKLHPG